MVFGIDDALMIGAPLLGGLVGNIASGPAQADAKAKQLAALQAIQNVNTPNISDLQVTLDKYGNPITVNPAMEGTVNQGATQLAGIQTDPRLMQAQMGALARLQSLSNGGLQPQDAAALAGIKNQINAQNHGQQGAILQEMQARGQGGSGATLAAQLAAQQAAMTQGNANSQNLGAQAAQRSLQALSQAGTLGGQIQAQQFSQEAQKANSQDAINRFNAANRQQIMGTNTGAQNQAQYYNVGNQNQTNRANVGLGNEQKKYNAQQYQTLFGDQLNKGTALANANNGAANQDLTRAGQTQSTFAGLGAALGTGAGAIKQGNVADKQLAAYNTRTAAMYPPKDSEE